eukprot:12771291-Ditylum_brightwellii.AAC.1
MRDCPKDAAASCSRSCCLCLTSWWDWEEVGFNEGGMRQRFTLLGNSFLIRMSPLEPIRPDGVKFYADQFFWFTERVTDGNANGNTRSNSDKQ